MKIDEIENIVLSASAKKIDKIPLAEELPEEILDVIAGGLQNEDSRFANAGWDKSF